VFTFTNVTEAFVNSNNNTSYEQKATAHRKEQNEHREQTISFIKRSQAFEQIVIPSCKKETIMKLNLKSEIKKRGKN
jgi:hypothetical protein